MNELNYSENDLDMDVKRKSKVRDKQIKSIRTTYIKVKLTKHNKIKCCIFGKANSERI